ncbi:hypothetical protein D6T65_15840 [Arthrobacter frigidicola]|nr:hypothetical protein D6T65_15840 [Arthrobacter frigidicola]
MTGFIFSPHQQVIAAYGAVLPGSVERHHETGTPEALLTSFHLAGEAMTAVAAFNAFPQLLTARTQLTPP